VILAGAVTVVLRYGFDHDYVKGLSPMFSLFTEQNVPTFVSTALMMLCAALLLLLASAARAAGRRGEAPYWLGLSFVFVFLAFDESMQFHEPVNDWLRSRFRTGGALYLPWIIPYGAGATALGVLYSRFLWRLPRNSRALIVISGAIFVAGAIGVELFEASFFEARRRVLQLDLLVMLEESCEFFGLGLFAYALARHAERHFTGIAVVFEPDRQAPGELRPFGTAASEAEQPAAAAPGRSLHGGRASLRQ
jgi:hypothetical protein